MEFFFKSKTPGEKARLHAAFEQFAREHHLPDEAQRRADLALEEAVANVLAYGFADEGEHTIAVKLLVEGGELVIEISDDGREFDPTTFPAPDLTAPAEERKIGGLGIHMMRQSVDALEYQRVDGRNVLRMRMRLGRP